MTFRVMTVCGTRPDAIKMAPVIRELGEFREQVTLINVVTGQHRQMLDQVLSVFAIRPDHDLAIMQERQTLTQVTVKTLEGLDPLLRRHRPDLVLVQGDTATTFLTGLSAFYHRIPVGHLEAGLRTGQKYDPFPEEMMRHLTTVLADLHFAPTESARRNLRREGVPAERIFVTGNTVIDALLAISMRPYIFEDPHLAGLLEGGRRLLLVTAHRRENWGEPMRGICRALTEIARRFPEVEILFPVHYNPIVREVVFPALEGCARIHLIDPPEYLPFVHLMKRSFLILTDSGGIQEEAPALGKPVLVLRQTTERPEAIAAGTARLVGTDPDRIVAETSSLLADEAAYRAMAHAANPYGDGQAARRIRAAIFSYFGLQPAA